MQLIITDDKDTHKLIQFSLIKTQNPKIMFPQVHTLIF